MAKRFVLFLLVLIIGPMLHTVRAQSGNDSATGHVNNWAGSDVDVDFSARSNFNGTQARGYARFAFRNMDPDAVVSGDVTCLIVVGNIATIGGVITDTRGGVIPGNAFVINALDSGKFSSEADTAGFFIGLTIPPAEFTAGAPCVTTFQLPVTDGEIVIHDALQ